MKKSIIFIMALALLFGMQYAIGSEAEAMDDLGPDVIVIDQPAPETTDIQRFHGIGVKPIYGFEAWEIRKDEDGKYVGALNTGAYFGAGIDIKLPDNAFLNWLDPQIEFGIHPEVMMGDNKFRIAVSAGIGLWTIVKKDANADGRLRVINIHVKKDLTGVPPGAGDTISVAFTFGFGLGKGGA
jgi:hypothetical protein